MDQWCHLEFRLFLTSYSSTPRCYLCPDAYLLRVTLWHHILDQRNPKASQNFQRCSETEIKNSFLLDICLFIIRKIFSRSPSLTCSQMSLDRIRSSIHIWVNHWHGSLKLIRVQSSGKNWPIFSERFAAHVWKKNVITIIFFWKSGEMGLLGILHTASAIASILIWGGC